MIPEDLRYSEEHEWVRVEGDVATIGITDFAQDQLGDIVEVELPKPGSQVKATKECGVVESVKTASDIFSPVTGEVVAANTSLQRLVDGKKNPDFAPDRVNKDPYGQGWLFKVKLTDKVELDKLLPADKYASLVTA
ncbi:MAG TPA: glycine cleavage system protein GcvH [Candidatus Xenobia bacterium]|jgi:glycine cleavage system H protein